MDERGEEQDHISALVHDRRATIGAANFARELVFGGLLGAVIPAQVMVAVGEIDVILVEDGGPLEWCTLRHGSVWSERNEDCSEGRVSAHHAEFGKWYNGSTLHPAAYPCSTGT